MTQGFVTDIPISTDTGLQPASNGLVPSQAAVKTYVDEGPTSVMLTGNNCFFRNLSFTHSAGVLTLAGADGTALSSANPGYILMPSNATEGRLVLHKITANDTLTVSDMTGNLFGTTTAIAWGTALPLYVGFMADASDANLEPVICRLPHLQVSPASSANIGDPSSATADQEYSVFAWNDITEANYQDMQVGIIGSVRATKAVTTDAWTLTALDARDGAGRFNDNRQFGFPTGQNGASASTYIKPNTGTAPVFSTNSYDYSISRDGQCVCHCRHSGDGGTDGAGAVWTPWTLPYRCWNVNSVDNIGIGAGQTSSATGGIRGVAATCRANSAPTSVELIENSTNASVLNSDWSSGARNIELQMSYKVAVS